MQQHIYIISELGSNHDQDLRRALNLIYQAKQAGADAAKFQFFRADSLVVSRGAPELWQAYKDHELPEEWLPILRNKCNEVGIDFLCTAYDEEGALKVEPYVRVHKVASFEAHSPAYVEWIGKRDRPVIISTGMMGMDDVLRLVYTLPNLWAILHCTSAYPAPYRDANLSAMAMVWEVVREHGLETGARVGLSDHTPGISVPIAAAGLGALCIEKHVTDDRTRSGPDHGISIDFGRLTEMVSMIREVEEALGDGVKRPTPSEEPMLRYRVTR